MYLLCFISVLLNLSATRSRSIRESAFLQNYISSEELMACNTSYTELLPRGYDSIRIRNPPSIPSVQENSTLYCVYELRAPKGYYVEAVVRELVTDGDFDTSGCLYDYLRIWDGLSMPAWKPSEFCGKSIKPEHDVRRVVSGREMKVEFRAEQYYTYIVYDVLVNYRKLEIDHGVVENSYGGYNDVQGLIPNTLCHWEIAVDQCKGLCEFTSPGYPGTYPPHANCSYKLVNREGERVQLYLSGSEATPGLFHLKKSNKCREDRIVVYDVESNSDPLTFCGELNISVIISTGSTLFVQFITYSGLPPWDYVGFRANVGYKTTDVFKAGMKIDGTQCNWEFNSTIDISGTMHTPDYYIHSRDEIKCEYLFFGRANEIVELEVKIFSPREEESVYLYDSEGPKVPQKITATEYPYKKYILTITSTPFIVYQLKGGQLSQARPIVIKYKFISDGRPDLVEQGISGSRNIEISNSLNINNMEEKTRTGSEVVGASTGAKSRVSPVLKGIIVAVITIVLRLFNGLFI